MKERDYVAMADLSNRAKRKLETLLGMGGGYVLDFSNATFQDFVTTAIGLDPYAGDYESKASLLRRIWREQSSATVSRLNTELLGYWKDSKLISGSSITDAEQQMYDELVSEFATSKIASDTIDVEFLNRDFSGVNLTMLPPALTSTAMVEARLDEIGKAMKAGAPLAVIFLVGSTLEGLLQELAIAQAVAFTHSKAAPKKDGKPKAPQEWTLSELISVARELGVVSADVANHADQVRNFRNYIHPRQQLKENFTPRIETAGIAQNVLLGAIKDLQALHERESGP
jgi:hypothetical protein